MKPFSGDSFPTPVTYVGRVVVPEDGDEEETWPGSGTALMAAIEQGTPKDRFTQSVEESTTVYTLWLDYQSVVDAGVLIRRGDQIRIPQAYGGEITLRVSAHATDFNLLGVTWMVLTSRVD